MLCVCMCACVFVCVLVCVWSFQMIVHQSLFRFRAAATTTATAGGACTAVATRGQPWRWTCLKVILCSFHSSISGYLTNARYWYHTYYSLLSFLFPGAAWVRAVIGHLLLKRSSRKTRVLYNITSSCATRSCERWWLPLHSRRGHGCWETRAGDLQLGCCKEEDVRKKMWVSKRRMMREKEQTWDSVNSYMQYVGNDSNRY